VEYEPDIIAIEAIDIIEVIEKLTVLDELRQTILLHQDLLLSSPESIPISPHFIFEHSGGYAIGDLTGNGL
jgi:hypothetical protein